jgi:transcriptional regulator with XRE-family HTH domain
MPHKNRPTMKHPRNATQAFPWRCNHCGENAVDMTTIEYSAEVRHDGRLYTFTIPSLRIPACRNCLERVFTDDVDRQINDALRLHLRVFTPDKFRTALDRVRLTQKEVAGRTGIAPATISRWLNGAQIQVKALDRYIRVFFAFPQVRQALAEDPLGPEFGTRDLIGENSTSVFDHATSPSHPFRSIPRSSWDGATSEQRDRCRRTQQIVQTTGTTWGQRVAR